MSPFSIIEGNSPVVLAFPHVGTYVPTDIQAKLNARGLKLSDTDWHVYELYSGLLADVTTVKANFHRYVIDANRDPEGVSMYPGQNTTTLVPTTDFDGLPIWKEGAEPTDQDVTLRLAEFHKAYHDALKEQLERVKEKFGGVVLYDCHSIRSNIPHLFEGKLPDFNIGTNEGTTCAPEFEAAVDEVCRSATQYTNVLNGRFKGGWTTRNYADPGNNVHVIQMELAQSTYANEEDPWNYIPNEAEKLRPVLKTILERIEATAFKIFS